MQSRILNTLNIFLNIGNSSAAITCFVLLVFMIAPGCKKNKPEITQPNYGNAILTFSLDSSIQVGQATITKTTDSAKVALTVNPYADLSAVTPKITVSAGATISPAIGQAVDFKSNGNSYTYVVTSKTGAKQTWYVKITQPPVDISTLKVYKDSLVTGFFSRQTGWIASDGGYTVPMDNGKVLWLFGDSYTNDYDIASGTTPCLFNERSTAMVQPFNNWDWHQTSTMLAPTALFRSNTADGYFDWPGAGLQLRDTVYVYCLNIMNSSGGLGFASGGNDVIAKMRISDLRIMGYHTLQDFNGIGFGLGIVKNDADGYVYVYGNKQTFIASNVFVGRFPISNPNANWTFWDGAAWNDDVKKSAPIGTAPSTSVQIAKVKDKYLMFSSEFSLGCDGGKEIYVAVSSNITGPFSDKKLIYTIDDTVDGHYPFFYGPIPHPEYINNKNEMLLTYSINGYGNCVPGCVNNRFNPNFYRPRGIRIPLKLIDPSL